MDEDREYRPIDEETFDRYVRYAFRPTAGPARSESTDEESTDGEPVDGSTEGTADGTGVKRTRRGLYRPDREDPVAVAGYHDFRTRIRGAYRGLGGVTAVATPPEHRRRGYVRDLLGRMLAELREEDIAFSALWPFKRSFYRRLGWETGSRSVRVEAPPAQLQSAGADPAGEFRSTAPDDWERLVPVHEAHDAGRGLHVERTEAWWRGRVFSGWRGDHYVYRWTDDDHETRAYLAYRVEDGDGDDGRTLSVSEWSWADPVARRQLLRFLGDHDSQVERVTFTEPFDPAVTLLETVEDPSALTVEVRAGAMVRLTDVVDGLSSLPYPEDVTDDLRIAVRDPLVDANDGTFALTVEGGRADCTPVDGTATVSLNVGLLSQLAVGYRDASAMAKTGHLDTTSDGVRRLDALFPPEPVWLREGF